MCLAFEIVSPSCLGTDVKSGIIEGCVYIPGGLSRGIHEIQYGHNLREIFVKST